MYTAIHFLSVDSGREHLASWRLVVVADGRMRRSGGNAQKKRPQGGKP
jgi:hypothetical protein